MSQQQLNEILSKGTVSIDHGNRACPVVQEHKEDRAELKVKTGNADHRPKKKKVDGPVYRPVGISINWSLSDKRRRDAWGMAETIADCLVAAARRLYLQHDPGATISAMGSVRGGINESDNTL